MFKKITIEDREIIREYVSKTKHKACDYSVANLVLWANVYGTEFAVDNGMLFIKFESDGNVYFTFPMGDGDLKAAFVWMQDYCKEQGIEFKMSIVEPEMFERIEETFPGVYDIVYMRDNADYVYNMEDLKNLSGKRYHGKKNHVNKFLKTQENWSYEQITDENTMETVAMVTEWCVQNGCCEDKDKAAEICVLIQGLKYRKELNLIGGLIRADGRVIAMTMGEKSDDDMFIVHFEKAFADIDGAFPIINQQFVTNELGSFKFVNREEDLGVEGLRKAKESYHPAFMAEKGYLVRK
jgi:hypothetical protein